MLKAVPRPGNAAGGPNVKEGPGVGNLHPALNNYKYFIDIGFKSAEAIASEV